MVDIYALRYTKAELAAAPENARIFYLLITGLANDLQILTRQYAIAVKQWDDELILRAGSSAVALLNLRLVAGRLQEGWDLIDKRFKPLSVDYEPNLSAKGTEALDALRVYFAKRTNLIYMIRNKIGFHADYGVAKTAFDRIPDDTEMVDYLSGAVGHTLFFGVETMHYEALRGLTGKTDELEAFGAVMDEVRMLLGHFLMFTSAFARVFIRKFLPQAYGKLADNKTVLPDLPGFNELQIPFFTEFPTVPK